LKEHKKDIKLESRSQSSKTHVLFIKKECVCLVKVTNYQKNEKKN